MNQIPRWRRLLLRLGLLVVLAGSAEAVIVLQEEDELPPPARGFTAQTVASGLAAPVAFRFAPDGRIFVAELAGTIKVLDGPGDGTPTLFADLSRNVYSASEHGLLNLALHPDFPRRPFVYVFYSYDAPIGGKAPTWGSPGRPDACPDPPGLLEEGCLTSGRLSYLVADADRASGPEHVLVNDWCHQSNTHSVGGLAFGPDGALYASAGDGAFWAFADYGQRGRPANPCGDPPGGVGAELRSPDSEGGSLRAQDLLTPGDPQTLDGTVIRIDPLTGEALPDNPLAEDPDENVRRVVAYGFKQPFRMAVRPGTEELWIAEVGHRQFEEINRIEKPATTVSNFGWPCYEGSEREHDYEGALMQGFDLCRQLYAAGPGAVVPPYYAYHQGDPVVPGEHCAPGGQAITGIAFAEGGYPGDWGRALFFADSTRGCIWALLPGEDGLPDRFRRRVVLREAGTVTDLQIGPDGKLYFVDLARGEIRRINSLG